MAIVKNRTSHLQEEQSCRIYPNMDQTNHNMTGYMTYNANYYAFQKQTELICGDRSKNGGYH